MGDNERLCVPYNQELNSASSKMRFGLVFNSPVNPYAEKIKMPHPLLIFSQSDTWSRLLIQIQILNGK